MPLIIVSSYEEDRIHEIDKLLSSWGANLDHPDVILLNEKLGIESIKKIREHLNWKPALAKKRVVVINPADSLTTDAQNGLLKILEEPSESALILLGVSKEDMLLPTIISRCEVRILNRSESSGTNDLNYLDLIIEKNTEDRLEALEKIDDRKRFLEDLVSFYHQKMSDSQKNLEIIKSFLLAEQWMKQNVAPKAITDYLMLVIPNPAK